MSSKPAILVCKCSHYKIIPDDVRSSVLAALESRGAGFEVVDDLCHLAAKRDPSLQRWAAAKDLRIVACFPRAVKWLFHAGHAPLKDNFAKILNMRTETVENISSHLLQDTPKGACKNIDAQDDKWIPWFPVIDYDRCASCKQCLNFCLFGVYELAQDGKVTVAKPASCKTNCPACAKMCPRSAIIFPKYTDAPINGDMVSDDSHKNLSEIFSGDIRQAIRDRTLNRLDIPADVLSSLSPQDIARINDSPKEAGNK
jgi:NAD-dependent dihydropyrimidine dehydrogenase PreA subunit